MIQNKKTRRVISICCSVLSLIFLGMIIITIKRLVEKDKEPASLQQTDFNLKRAKQAQKQKKTKKMVHNKRDKIKRKLKALKPLLNSNLSGLSFGLELGDMSSVNLLDRELLDSNENVVMDENSVDQKPRALEKPSVEFPEKALADNVLKGTIELRMLITKKGVVEDVEVISASPKGYFEDSALTMVSSWSFQPAKYGGKPVAMWAKQVVRFGE